MHGVCGRILIYATMLYVQSLAFTDSACPGHLRPDTYRQEELSNTLGLAVPFFSRIMPMVLPSHTPRWESLMLPDTYDLTDRLYISTIADDCDTLARSYGVGLEIADFCTAVNMDEIAQFGPVVHTKMRGINRFSLHMPFNEITPAAIDPLVVDLTRKRYEQALSLAMGWGIKRLIVHTGFIPIIYYPQWYLSQATEFWQEFLADKPSDILICVENVMEATPDMICELMARVDDPRLRICLDVGHANTRVSNVPWKEWVDAMQPYLVHFHIHNNDGDADLHDALGAGVLPMCELLRVSIDACPKARFTIENAHAEESMLWLKNEGFLSSSNPL